MASDAEHQRPFPPAEPDCELCRADRWTHWYAVTDDGWIADCEVCAVPMAVWWHHGPDATAEVQERLLAALAAAADERFGAGNWQLDTTMRQVPDHFHAHARDRHWRSRRFSRAMSRYSGVGRQRQTTGLAET